MLAGARTYSVANTSTATGTTLLSLALSSLTDDADFSEVIPRSCEAFLVP